MLMCALVCFEHPLEEDEGLRGVPEHADGVAGGLISIIIIIIIIIIATNLLLLVVVLYNIS